MKYKLDKKSFIEALKTIRIDERQEMVNPASVEATDGISFSFDS